MRARFIQEIGTMAWLRIYWSQTTLVEIHEEGGRRYKDHLGCNGRSYHNALTFLGRTTEKEAWGHFGNADHYKGDLRWPTQCDHCGAPIPESSKPQVVGESGYDVQRQVFVQRMYNTDSGKPEPGDIYEESHQGDYPCAYWDNCTGIHLTAVLPNGDHWDINSRASNCTRRDDRTHRCWVTHGTAQEGTLHVDKNGDTCQAGAGSIASRSWHGFLHNFEFKG